MKTFLCLFSALILVIPLAMAHEGHDDMKDMKDGKSAGSETSATITGEVIDMVCYIDHGATGEKHVSCAKTCIESGLPVGLKATDGKIYLLIGEHKPINKQLVESAGKTITVKGKIASRDGVNMIENVEILK